MPTKLFGNVILFGYEITTNQYFAHMVGYIDRLG